MQTYFVYMLAAKPYGTLYISVTNNIISSSGGSLSLAGRCAAGNSDLSARRNGSRGQAPR